MLDIVNLLKEKDELVARYRRICADTHINVNDNRERQ